MTARDRYPLTSPTRDRRWLWLDGSLAVTSAVLLIFSLAKWRGWIGGEPIFRPVAMIYLAAAMLLQPIGRHVERRSLPVSLAFMAASLALLVGAVMAG